MLGPNYGKWWNERPLYARLRYGLMILPAILILLWMLYQYKSGVYLRSDIRNAVDCGNLGDIRALIKNGASADTKYNNGMSLLHQALANGHIKIVRQLIKEGAEVNVADQRGITPMHLAAGKGNTEIVKILIQKGADPSARSEQYGLPLHWASNSGQIKT
ncbi:MAG: ankyrin repeat domain-containing protein, partial [Desulfobacula sp.]|nr:ankyrin repeat domain-containing protein [Desulfobacula sp.]